MCVFTEPHNNTPSQAENFDLHKFGHKRILKSLSSIAARIRIRCCLELIFPQPYKFEKKALSKTQMEEDLMSAKEAVALSNGEIAKHEGAAKRQRFDRCFSFLHGDFDRTRNQVVETPGFEEIQVRDKKMG
ncbi:hypothetical protein Acr_16g0008630 [Actinidia rufa]|uniref:Uncharacterized protein n=1 Tax=Actinidia rufa TaxID=165716 RepID=A0A7J0FZX1_9ERIC|nr:hypothetical protein Acr_16g0008630 [Actinidia rufa]